MFVFRWQKITVGVKGQCLSATTHAWVEITQAGKERKNKKNTTIILGRALFIRQR